ncbi:MAG: PrpF domain-containing protein [Armatimonadota bacterium]|nr:PrpF domain-containing protein [Armatimonadota bacterium]
MGRQIPIRCVIMRGGTSKGLFLRANDLPSDPVKRDRVILALFGSPDPRQIDGLGGADILTSKVIIVGPPSRPDADLDYTFGQVSITEPFIDYDINCGNLSAAVGVYALEEGWVRAVEPVTRVRMHNTNTRSVLVAEVPVADGVPQVEGEFAIDGVPGTGAEIVLDYTGSVGASTGRLLPMGRPTERIHVPILDRMVPVSVVDIANLCVFFPAEAVGLKGTEGPHDLTSDHAAAIVAIKTEVARLLDLPRGGLIPIPIAVAPPRSYRAFTGKEVDAGEIHLLARLIGGRPPVMHKTFAATAAVCTAVAAAIPGSVPFEVCRSRSGEEFVIGHPSGTFPLRVRVVERDEEWMVERAAYSRTARRLMEGYAFIRPSVLEE